MTLSSALSLGTYIAEKAVQKEAVTRGGILKSAGIGLACGAIGGKGMNGKKLEATYKAATSKLTRSKAATSIAKYTQIKEQVASTVKEGIANYGVSTSVSFWINQPTN